MPARKYPDEVLDQAAELRERGLSSGEIARKLDMTVGSVNWHCLRLGADAPDGHRGRIGAYGPQVMRRGNHQVRRFTPEEDRKIIEMELSGATIAEICRALGRKHNSIIGRLMTLARHEARAEGEAAND